jgi:hypothetical protein
MESVLWIACQEPSEGTEEPKGIWLRIPDVGYLRLAIEVYRIRSQALPEETKFRKNCQYNDNHSFEN